MRSRSSFGIRVLSVLTAGILSAAMFASAATAQVNPDPEFEKLRIEMGHRWYHDVQSKIVGYPIVTINQQPTTVRVSRFAEATSYVIFSCIGGGTGDGIFGQVLYYQDGSARYTPCKGKAIPERGDQIPHHSLNPEQYRDATRNWVRDTFSRARGLATDSRKPPRGGVLYAVKITQMRASFTFYCPLKKQPGYFFLDYRLNSRTDQCR